MTLKQVSIESGVMAKLPKYRTISDELSHTTLIVVDNNTLYAKATYSSRHTVLYCYHAGNNVWDQVCAKEGGYFNVVHLHSYFYFIAFNYVWRCSDLIQTPRSGKG